MDTIWKLGHRHGIALAVNSLEILAGFVQIQGKETSLVVLLEKQDWMVDVLVDLDVVKRVAYKNVADAALLSLGYAECPYYKS